VSQARLPPARLARDMAWSSVPATLTTMPFHRISRPAAPPPLQPIDMLTGTSIYWPARSTRAILRGRQPRSTHAGRRGARWVVKFSTASPKPHEQHHNRRSGPLPTASAQGAQAHQGGRIIWRRPAAKQHCAKDGIAVPAPTPKTQSPGFTRVVPPGTAPALAHTHHKKRTRPQPSPHQQRTAAAGRSIQR